MNPDQIKEFIVELGKYILGSLIGGGTTYYFGFKYVSNNYISNRVLNLNYIKKSATMTQGNNSPALNNDFSGANINASITIKQGGVDDAMSQPKAMAQAIPLLVFDADRQALTDEIVKYVGNINESEIKSNYMNGIAIINSGGNRGAFISFSKVFTPIVRTMQAKNDLRSTKLEELLNYPENTITKDNLDTIEKFLYQFFTNI